MWHELYREIKGKHCGRKNEPSPRDASLIDSALPHGFHTQISLVANNGFFNNVYVIGKPNEAAGIVKVPKNVPYYGLPTAFHLQTEVSMLQKHQFPMPPTEVAPTSPQWNTGVLLSGYVPDFAPLTYGMLRDCRELQQQLRDILCQNDAMIVEDGCSLDLMGYSCFKRYLETFRLPLATVRKSRPDLDFVLSENLVVSNGSILNLDSGPLWTGFSPYIHPKYVPPHSACYNIVNQCVFNDIRTHMLGMSAR